MTTIDQHTQPYTTTTVMTLIQGLADRDHRCEVNIITIDTIEENMLINSVKKIIFPGTSLVEFIVKLKKISQITRQDCTHSH